MSDKTTIVCYINNMGGSKSRACNVIAKSIWQFSLKRNNFLSSVYVPGKQNTMADSKSRVFNDRTEWMLNPEVFQKLSQLWGHFEIDLFASRSNKQIGNMYHGKQTLVQLLWMLFQCCGSESHFMHSLPFLSFPDVYRRLQQTRQREWSLYSCGLLRLI